MESTETLVSELADFLFTRDFPKGRRATHEYRCLAAAVVNGEEWALRKAWPDEVRFPIARQPRKPRSVKVEDELWDAAMRKAEQRGEVLSEVIRKHLKRYVAKR